MRLHTLSIAAALLASTVALAQAQVPPGSEGAATGASSGTMEPADMTGTPSPSGKTMKKHTGSGAASDAADPDNGGANGTTQPADMTGTPSPSGKTIKKHTDYSTFPDDNDNPDNGGANDETHSDGGAMTGGSPTGRDDSNRGSSPDGGTNGVTPH
jgi:hypothetical protein